MEMEQPRTKDGDNSFGGLGVTIVDSLDTLYIMGLKDQFRKAKEYEMTQHTFSYICVSGVLDLSNFIRWVVRSLDFNRNHEVGVFETTIRL